MRNRNERIQVAMTREEANQILHCPDTVGGIYSEKYGQALDIAMKALEQKPCEDAIYRQAAIRLAEQGQVQGFAWQLRKLIALPSVRPTSKKGKWIENDKGVIVCSCCNTWFPRERKEFMLSCPYCSAEMENASNGRR